MRCGLIGCGYWGKNYCRLLKQKAHDGKIQFTAVHEKDPKARQWLRDQKFPLVEDFDAFLAQVRHVPEFDWPSGDSDYAP